MSDLQLSAQDEVLLESLVLAASDNVTRAPAPDRDQYAPERRRAFVETSGAGNVYLGTGDAWVDVSENTGLLSSLFQGGDVNANSVNTDSASVTNQLDAGSVNTGSADIKRSGPEVMSWAFDGADADARLDAALSAASSGDVIYLESDTYTDVRTISQSHVIIGTESSGRQGTVIGADWTFDGRVDLKHVNNFDGSVSTLTFNASDSGLYHSIEGDIEVTADEFKMIGQRIGSVTFQSGTTGGVVDGSTGVTVTDNGTNTQGTIG